MTNHDATRNELVAARLRALRTARGWTQTELSRALAGSPTELTASQISKLEAGTRRIDLDELANLANALTTTVEHLVRPGQLCASCGQETDR